MVSIIIIATVAMPAIENASTTTTTTTTTEIQDVEVSNPIYFTDSYPFSTVFSYNDGVVSIQQQYFDNTSATYSIPGDFTNIPILISDVAVCTLSKTENSCYVYGSGIQHGYENYSFECDLATTSFKFMFRNNQLTFVVGTNGIDGDTPNWAYVISATENSSNYVTSTTQESVTLGSLDEIVAGSARYLSTNARNYAYIYNGEQTQYGDYALGINSVQTDAGVDVSLKASYGDTEVLILVPTTTEITITQTITVQTEYGPILNVVLLMLLIVPVTAVAAMLYTRRD